MVTFVIKAAARLVAMRARPLTKTGEGQVITPMPRDTGLEPSMGMGYLVLKRMLDTAPVVDLRVDSLVAIQYSVDLNSVNRYKRGDRHPIKVACINGTNYIIDGTHRSTAAWALRETHIRAHYLVFDNLDLHMGRLDLKDIKRLIDNGLRK